MDTIAKQQALEIAAQLRRCTCGFDNGRTMIAHRSDCLEAYRPSVNTVQRRSAADLIDILVDALVVSNDHTKQALDSAQTAVGLANEATDMLNAVKAFALLAPNSMYTRALLEIIGEKVPDGD